MQSEWNKLWSRLGGWFLFWSGAVALYGILVWFNVHQTWAYVSAAVFWISLWRVEWNAS